jgi:hypothetical protein
LLIHPLDRADTPCYATLNNDEFALKLVQCSQTRWLSIETAVNKILEQWDLKRNLMLQDFKNGATMLNFAFCVL